MSDAPIPTDKKSIKMELQPGTYWWCSCGRTSHSPFCDGSHKGTGLQPKKFILDATTTVSLCQCKASLTAPFCDGSHRQL